MRVIDTVLALAAIASLADAAPSLLFKTHHAIAQFPGITIKAAKPLNKSPNRALVKDTISHHVVNLRGQNYHGIIQGFKKSVKKPAHGSRPAAVALGALQRQEGGVGYENITSASHYGTQYGALTYWAGQPHFLLIDSGSADTWMVVSNYTCTDYMRNEEPRDTCNFGPGYVDDENNQKYTVVPNQHIFVEYADTQFVSGPVVKMNVSVGGIEVKGQVVGLANETYWRGNGNTSGILGLAYSSLTSAYWGSDGGDNGPDTQVNYSPIFTSMWGQGLIAEPIWSMAIDRNASTGIVAFGGLPPVQGDNDAIAYADILIVS